MQTIEKLQRLGSAASWDSCGGVKQKSLRKAGVIVKRAQSFIQVEGARQARMRSFC